MKSPHETTAISFMWATLFLARAVGVFVAGSMFSSLGFEWSAVVAVAPLLIAAVCDETSRQVGKRGR